MIGTSYVFVMNVHDCLSVRPKHYTVGNFHWLQFTLNEICFVFLYLVVFTMDVKPLVLFWIFVYSLSLLISVGR